jgi:hypothetical protein
MVFKFLTSYVVPENLYICFNTASIEKFTKYNSYSIP